MAGILLDTHIFLWLTANDPRLSAKAREMIEGESSVFVSAASIWEIAIKVRLGKLKGDPADLIGEMQANGFLELPIYARHAKEVASLPLHHGDPFDRLLIGQAISEQLRLLTADPHLAPYSKLVVVF
jgi:PIN domain nuclease of toxin-antitoxin system